MQGETADQLDIEMPHPESTTRSLTHYGEGLRRKLVQGLASGEPSLSLPCYAERRYGGVPDDELLMATPPEFLPKMIRGLEALSRNGLRYPIPPYGIQNDVRAGLGASYPAGK